MNLALHAVYLAYSYSTEVADTCLLQLNKGPHPFGEAEVGQLVEATQDVSSKQAVDEVVLQHQVNTKQARADEPNAPKWESYPPSLARVLDEMVVTRWHGTMKETQSGGLSSPLPALFERFDCVVHQAYSKSSSWCKTLLVSPKGEYLDLVHHKIHSGDFNVHNAEFVAFFGCDQHLSSVYNKVKVIMPYFKKSYFEGYDKYDSEIDVLPIGLSEYYLRFQDWKVLLELANEKIDPAPKPEQATVLGAFGAFWPEFNSEPSRSSAQELCNAYGLNAWLTCGEVPKEKWWSTLSSYHFLLDPSGGGVQSTKFYEALLARAVPICTSEPAFVKLHAEGWPILVVDDYKEIAHMDLTKIYQELKPRLAAVQPLLHLDGYWTYLKTGYLPVG
jgi:hypothetical protein